MSLSLRSLSDNEVLSRVLELTRRERAATLLVLLHLNEIERRRLHLKQGYASMYAYCTSGLGYSTSGAGRRIRAARCGARFPEVYALLEANEVNVSTVSQVAHILTVDNKDAVLARIRGKSQREVEAIVAEYAPLAAVPSDRVRSVVVRVPLQGLPAPTDAGAWPRSGASPAPERAPESAPVIPAAAPATAVAGPAALMPMDHNRNGCGAGSPAEAPAGPTRASVATTLEKRTSLAFCASEDFRVKLLKFQSLMCFRLPANPSLAQVFELALDYVLEKEDPEKRRERLAERSSPRAPRTEVKPRRQPQYDPRRIPARIRDEVFVRDKNRCAFVGSNGRRCEATHALQVDHIQPVARDGTSTLANLRLLCAYHNRLEAERMMGRAGRREARGTRAPAPGRENRTGHTTRDLPIHNRYGCARGVTTDSSPTPRARGSSRGRPSRARP